MASALGSDEVLRIAALARLELTDEEVALFGRQLAAILSYAEAIQEADTSGVPPTSHPLLTAARWREDEPAPPLTRDAALEAAPDTNRTAGLFRVPKVI